MNINYGKREVFKTAIASEGNHVWERRELVSL